MSKTGIEITIPEPCTQQWQHLEPRPGGRFCGACEQLVVDFTRMSDRELLAYFKNHPGDVCGSFHPGQTDRVIAAREDPQKRFLLPRLAAAVAGLLLSVAGKAQTADTLRATPLTEISPIAPKPVTVPVTAIGQPADTAAGPLVHSQFPELQGKVGGVCVKGVAVEEEKPYKNSVFHKIEEMLRHF